jgi:adenosylcobyric acid synthase
MLGVLPWLQHGLPDEDGATTPSAPARGRTVAVLRYPTASNLDEFKPLEQLGVLRWATDARGLDDAYLVVLPGSKQVAADLAWLRRTGIAQVIRDRAAGGRPLLGICGGLQMLGERLEDDAGVDGSATGLGLLALHTRYAAAKRTEQTVTRFTHLTGPWAPLSGLPVSGYQIRHGSSRPTAALSTALPDGLGYVAGPILGIYLHGMFESPALVGALLGERPARSLEQAFEQLADAIEEHLDVGALLDTTGVAQ